MIAILWTIRDKMIS